MFRRMLISALLLMGAATLYGCSATRTISANSDSTFRERGLTFTGDRVQTAARIPGAGLSSTRSSGNSLSKRAVVRLGQDFEVEGLTLSPVRAHSLPGWQTERHGDALAAFRKSCKVLEQRAPEESASKSALGGQVGDWQDVCARAAALNPNDHPGARAFFEDQFSAFEVRGEGTFTGYYEAEIKASRKRSSAYHWPLYQRPPELVSGEPYFTREEIERGALRNRGLELLYVDNPVDVFMLHIQGSGVVKLDDGSVTRVGYAANNQHPFEIGRAHV